MDAITGTDTRNVVTPLHGRQPVAETAAVTTRDAGSDAERYPLAKRVIIWTAAATVPWLAVGTLVWTMLAD